MRWREGRKVENDERERKERMKKNKRLRKK